MQNIVIRERDSQNSFGPDDSQQEMNEGQFEMFMQRMFPSIEQWSAMMERFEEEGHLEFSRNSRRFLIAQN